MSSEAVGMQAHIKKESPKAVYTHCCGHNLALVITTACKIPVINNVLATMKDASSMFVRGSKKMTLLGGSAETKCNLWQQKSCF